MIKGANPQAPPLDPNWVRFLNARDDMVKYLIERQGYSNLQISLTMSTFLDTIDYIVKHMDDKPGGGPSPDEIAKLKEYTNG